MKNTQRAMAGAVDSEETTWMLQMAIAQIDVSLQESDACVGDLVESVTEAATAMCSIIKDVPRLLEAEGKRRGGKSVSAQCEKVESSLQRAIVALQFYDRMSQRILHTREDLCVVAEALQGDEEQLVSLRNRLQKNLDSVYSADQKSYISELELTDTLIDSPISYAPGATSIPGDRVELF